MAVEYDLFVDCCVIWYICESGYECIGFYGYIVCDVVEIIDFDVVIEMSGFEYVVIYVGIGIDCYIIF